MKGLPVRMDKIGIISGGWDPLHSGHIKYIKAASELCDYLIVGVNSDAWLVRKKGKNFLDFHERAVIIQNIKGVAEAVAFNDDDGSAVELIREVKAKYPAAEYIFMNGGDRTKENIPEMSEEGVTFLFGVGGDDKANSSSWILKKWESKE